MKRLTFGLFLLLTTHAALCDGEGSARMLPEGDFVAGNVMTLEVEVAVGPEGVPVGGGVAVLFHHIFRQVQLTAPDRDGYAQVSCATDDNVRVEWHNWVPKGSFPKADGIFRQGLIATVVNAALQPGEKVRFILGAGPAKMRWPIVTDTRHEVRAFTDTDGDGKFARVQSDLINDVVAGPAHHLWVTAPSTAIVGRPIEVVVRAEDAPGNVAESCEVEVELSGIADGARVALVKGMGGVSLIADKPGLYRVGAEADTLTGRSNPINVTEQAPKYQVFWGDMHGHTQNSDGLGETAEEYYEYARDAADLDVCALTDHGTGHLELCREAVKAFHDPGRFVTFLGWEWDARPAGHGDKCFYVLNPDDPPFAGWPRTAPDMFKAVEAVYGDNEDRRIITGPHMFTYPDALGWPGVWDARYERFAEIYSGHGMSEFYGNPRPLWGAKPGAFTQDALAKGLRFGIIGSSDNHDSHPGRHCWGRYRGGLVAFLAKELTRESIWDAFWNRRVYAATTDRIYIDFQIDGHVMGEEFETATKPEIQYTVHGCDDELDVVLIKDNAELRRTTSTTGSVTESLTDETFDASSYYYVRAEQANGERARSSPIWVDRTK